MSKYKIVIIGAGQAGLRCAKILAENKENFILLEAREKIGRKICAGLYGPPGDAWAKTDYSFLPETARQKEINSLVLSYRKKSRTIFNDSPLLAIVDREELSRQMYQEALAAGANIRFGSPVAEIGDSHVVSNGEKIYFDYLVAADGANSIVRRKIGLKRSHHLGLQYWLQQESDEAEIEFIPGRRGAYYACLAPHRGRTSIGIGGDIDLETPDTMKNDLLRYCSKKGFDLTGAGLEGAFIGCDYQGYQFGQVFLAGDAAGFASELTGEGIQPAIASGEEIAKIIINPKYRPVKIEKILKKKKSHRRVAETRKYLWLAEAGTIFLLVLLRFKVFWRRVVKSIA